MIVFNPPCSSENVMHTLQRLSWANSVWVIFHVRPLIRRSCVSILAVNITFALIFGLRNSGKPVFVCFWFRATWINDSGYLELSGILYLPFIVQSSTNNLAFLIVEGAGSCVSCFFKKISTISNYYDQPNQWVF